VEQTKGLNEWGETLSMDDRWRKGMKISGAGTRPTGVTVVFWTMGDCRPLPRILAVRVPHLEGPQTVYEHPRVSQDTGVSEVCDERSDRS
jgi:hypothetical protein